MAQVTLRPISSSNVRDVCKLSVSKAQQNYVASNAQSLAEANFADHAWFRSIYFGEDPVGFVMLSVDPGVWGSVRESTTKQPRNWRTMIWRFMVDARYQGRGIGREAMRQTIAEAKAQKVTTLWTSYLEGEDSPSGFYSKLGFAPTGEIEAGEVLAKITIESPVLDVSDSPVIVDEPSECEIEEIDNHLEKFNQQQVGHLDFQPLQLVLRAQNGELLGGLKAQTGWEWMYVQILWVRPSLHRQGYGSQLIKAAENEAVRRGCRGTCLSTFTFQAPEFYEKLGYQRFGTIPDYPPNQSLMFYSKRLDG